MIAEFWPGRASITDVVTEPEDRQVRIYLAEAPA